jgi:hypothetical protein
MNTLDVSFYEDVRANAPGIVGWFCGGRLGVFCFFLLISFFLGEKGSRKIKGRGLAHVLGLI